VGAGAPPAGWESLPASSLPPELHGRAHRRRGYPEGLGENSFSVRYALGSDTMPALRLLGGTTFDSLDFYYHEAFHGFQHGRGGFVTVPTEPRASFKERLADSAHVAGPEFTALGEVERRMLDDALGLPTGDALRAHVRGYLAVRHRRAGTHADVWAAERRMERWEGTAQLVGCQAAAAVLGEPDARAVACVREELRTPLSSWTNFPEADARLMRWRQYGTGSAIALLLDRLGVAWRPAVAGGTAPDQLLADAVGFDARSAEALADAALARYRTVPAGARP
jgi:hypothetical protein